MSAAIHVDPLESGELEDVDLENAGPLDTTRKANPDEAKKNQHRSRFLSPVCVVVLLLVILVVVITLSIKHARSKTDTTAESLRACSWQRLVPPDESEKKKFGAILAVDDKTIAVAAQGDASNGPDSGAAYVFRLDKDTGKFKFHDKLIPHDGKEGDVAQYTDVSGKFVVLGAKKHDHRGESSGAVYVFMEKGNGEFIEEAEILPAELEAGDMLGNQLAIDGKTLLIGARRTNEGRGAVYAYHRTRGRWKPYGEVILPTGVQLIDDEFGGRINFQGKTAVITKNGPNGHWSDAGSAYIFQDNGQGFQQLQQLFPDEIGFDNYAKKAVDISQDEATVVIGAYKTDLTGAYKGFVYVFTRGDDGMYYQSDKIMPEKENKDYLFGHDVALRGNLLLVLAETAHEEGNTGLVYVFARESETEGWAQQTTLTRDESLPSSIDGFGSSLAILDDRTVVIGSRYTESSSGLDKSGSAYVIKLC